ncbi:hypothetical protein F0248_08460 [Vibrio crassostreae]|uniref:hypothetical protein n=1 Tax=Vibrio crassostreae TaxID=246167 RepID=UPI00148DF250|nr:hypothetical protein [Vibrio crassostreae]NOI53113.1 hypothetical protein [Vibrio crassostreae]
MKNFKVIDKQDFNGQSYLSIVFLRGKDLKSEVSLFKWIKLTLVELAIGVELLESIIMSFSIVPYENYKNRLGENYGATRHLSIFVPYGIFNNIVREVAIEVLFYKYHKQYYLLQPAEEYEVDEHTCSINCTRTRFSARKELFTELIAFRRVYELFWLFFNLSIDIIVYLLSNSIEATIITAMVIEGIRRSLRV